MVRQLHAALTVPKHFSFNPQAEVFVPIEQQSIAERQEEELIKLKQTNADTTAVCCLCESSVPTTPLSLAFCESCSPITRFCKTFHVRGPQARIASYYKGVRTPWNFGARTTTEGGFMQGLCIVCVKPNCTRIQRRGEYQEYCCPRCHYQNKREVLAGDEESSDPEEESDECSKRESEDSDDYNVRT